MQQVGHLQKLHEKYFEKGLRVIAISAEPTGTLDGAVTKDRGGRYWMASDPGRETMSRYSTPGGLGIPRSYLIDATGKVVGDGMPSEARIEELLQGVLDTSVGKTLHKSLNSAVKAFEKGDYGKAFTTAGKQLGKEDRTLVADAEYLQTRCNDIAAFYRKLVEGNIEAKDFPSAYEELGAMPKRFKGMEVAEWSLGKAKELDEDPNVQREMAAWKMFEKGRKKQASAKGKAKKMGPARKAYESVMKKYPGTRAAALAEDAIKSLPKKK